MRLFRKRIENDPIIEVDDEEEEFDGSGYVTYHNVYTASGPRIDGPQGVTLTLTEKIRIFFRAPSKEAWVAVIMIFSIPSITTFLIRFFDGMSSSHWVVTFFMVFGAIAFPLTILMLAVFLHEDYINERYREIRDRSVRPVVDRSDNGDTNETTPRED